MGDETWGVVALVAGRVETDSARPATRGAFNSVLRNMVMGARQMSEMGFEDRRNRNRDLVDVVQSKSVDAGE